MRRRFSRSLFFAGFQLPYCNSLIDSEIMMAIHIAIDSIAIQLQGELQWRKCFTYSYLKCFCCGYCNMAIEKTKPQGKGMERTNKMKPGDNW